MRRRPVLAIAGMPCVSPLLGELLLAGQRAAPRAIADAILEFPKVPFPSSCSPHAARFLVHNVGPTAEPWRRRLAGP